MSIRSFRSPTSFITWVWLFLLAVLISGAVFAQELPLATPGSSAQEQIIAGSPRELTAKDGGELPACRGIIDDKILSIANSAAEDPAVVFERNRRLHPHMIMLPAPLDCASQLWRVARKTAEPVDLMSVIRRQFSPEAVFDLSFRSAAVGSNIDPAGGTGDYQGETSISIDPNNPLHIVGFSNTFFKDSTPACVSPTGGTANTYGTMSLYGSTDGGATWTYNCAPWPASVTGGVTGATFWFGSDPALAWDNQGGAYATYMLISQSASASGASIVTARSIDNGATWQSLGTVTSGITSTTIGNDKEMMAIDNTSGQANSHLGRIYVIWDAANAEKIAYSDNGTSWTTVNFASNTGAIGGNVVVGADGTVYAIWNRYNVETIVFSKSTNGGVTWTAPAVISTMALQSFGTNNLPAAQDQRGVNAFGAIDIDRNPASAYFGTLYVSFPDFPTGTTSGSDINTYVIRSTNGGTTWSTRVKVNDDNFGATQFFPWLAVDQSDGTVNVSWLDTRLDPLNRKTQAVYARSSDGGASFEPNILVTDGGLSWRNNVNFSDENSADNTAYNGNQYGDYTGIAALNRQVHPLWTDSRMFFPTADTQSPTRREDNATTTIVNCSAPDALGTVDVDPTTSPNVAITWSAPASWGINATAGTYTVFRNTTPVLSGATQIAAGLTSSSYVDATGTLGLTYYYFVAVRNNCPGTVLTPMTTTSAASAAVVIGAGGTPVGILQGTVRSGGSVVAGVAVTAGAFSAITNASGFYQFPAIPAGGYSVSTTPSGYAPTSINGVSITGGVTTTQDLSLTSTAGNTCSTDTSFGDFSVGSGSNVDIAVSPGDVKLASLGSETVDQNNTSATTISTVATATTWAGQTFRSGKSGNLTKISIGLGLNSGTTGTVTVEIHDISGATPGSTTLATGTLGPVTNASGTVATYTTTFGSPATLASGTSYSVVVKGISNNVYVVRSGNTVANGALYSTTDSGGTWTAGSGDMTFTTYVTPPITYQTSGNFISTLKDSGAVAGSSVSWGTIAWNNAALPAGTSLQFQAAASNSSTGPFNFVGPDGTAGTFFSTGASLPQFNGFRYLKYKSIFATSNTANTPTLSDVTVCSTTAPITFGVSGTVIYGTVPSGVIDVGGVTLTATGSPSVSNSSSAVDGTYSMSGFGSGSYTVTPSKTRQVSNTGITLQDASEVAKYAFNQVIPNANQTIASDATGDGSISLQDASEIAKRSFNIASTNVVGTWKFTPATRQYSALAANQSSQDFTAIMVGDVTGNWTAPGIAQPGEDITNVQPAGVNLFTARSLMSSVTPAPFLAAGSEASAASATSINVSLPANASGNSGQTVLIPVTVGDLTGQNITSYDMTVSFDPNVLDPATTPYDTSGTLTGAAGYQVVVDPSQPAGKLRVGAFGFLSPLSGQGTLIYLKFNVKPGYGATFPLAFVQCLFGEGQPTDPSPATSNGLFTRFAPTGAEVSIAGRALTATGNGVVGAVITVSGTGNGARMQTITSPFGYFHIDGLDAGDTYVVTVRSKRFVFANPNRVVTLNDSIDDILFTADPQQ